MNNLQQVAQFPIGVDVDTVNEGRQSKPSKQAKLLQSYFDPKIYVQQHQPLEVQNYKLSEEELYKYAVMSNEIRMKILLKAKEEDDKLTEVY